MCDLLCKGRALPRCLLMLMFVNGADWVLAARGEISQMATAQAERNVTVDNKAGRKLRIPTVELVDQDGRRVVFGNEFLRGKLAAINFVFTSCPTICPLLGINFSRLEEVLMKTNSNDVELISISVDPATDTPERLKAWSNRFGRQGKWRLLTGSPQAVEKVLRGFEASTRDKTSHSPLVWIGSEWAGEWRRVDGIASTTNLVRTIQELVTAARRRDERMSAARSGAFEQWPSLLRS